MKINSLWKKITLSAVALTAGILVACQTRPSIEVKLLSPSDIVSLSGGEVHFSIAANGDWTATAADEDGNLTDQVTFSKASGTGNLDDLTVTVAPGSTTRQFTLTFTVTKLVDDEPKSASQSYLITQTDEPNPTK